jgi:hypothetical protein
MKRVHPSLVLLIVAVFAYSLLISQLGFYWDDVPISWISYELGSQALTQYFSSNRPIWGILFQITNRLIPQEPLYWQMFALTWRWLCAVLFWAIFSRLRPDRTRQAILMGLVFLLYPGFNQHWIAYLYSHVYIVLFFLLLSFYLMLRGGRLNTILALGLSALNLWMHEYFFVLELARPLVLWSTLRDKNLILRERVGKTAAEWTPYLVVFGLAAFSRIFIFNNQVYGIGRTNLEASPVATRILYLFQDILASLWTGGFAAWSQVVRFPNPVTDGLRISLLYAAVLFTTALFTILALSAKGDEKVVDHEQRKGAQWLIGAGLVIMLLGGAPWWLTGNPISLNFPASRALLSFIPGACLIFAGIFELIPARARYPLAVILISLAAGSQFLASNDYRRDWAAHKNYFWQMSWRAPGLAADTLVFSNEALAYYADNSMAAALNWIYGGEQNPDRLEYALFYPTNRLGGSLPSLEAEIPIQFNFLAGTFQGNTSQSAAFYYDPPGCVRLLDPEIDTVNHLIPADSLMREAAVLSSTSVILQEARVQMPNPYYPEPEHGWCYYFEKADLMRQAEDWQAVVDLGAVAFSLDDHPNDPFERFVFIEGYAHTGDWDNAGKYSMESYKVSREILAPPLCKLWQRIDRNTHDGDEKNEIVSQMKTNFSCDW